MDKANRWLHDWWITLRWAIGAVNANHITLRILAPPSADHPDYREEWKP